jgi:lipopolysaccharide transport system ATP-binding protein
MPDGKAEVGTMTDGTTAVGQQLPRPLIFIHVKKAPGRSVEALLREHYGHPRERLFNGSGPDYEAFASLPQAERDQPDLLMGHVVYGVHTLLSRPAQYITMLREPVDRVISHYYWFLERNPDHPAVQTGTTLAEWAAGFDSDNLQVRYLSGLAQWRVRRNQLAPGALEAARRNLETHVAAFGLTERFVDSLEAMAPVVGWGRVEPVHRNATKVRIARDAIDPATERAIRANNELDIELYAFAQGLFERRLREVRTRRFVVRRPLEPSEGPLLLPVLATVTPLPTTDARRRDAVARPLVLARDLALRQRARAADRFARQHLLPAPLRARLRGVSARRAGPAGSSGGGPIIIAATHWKAGSQWIAGILDALAPGRVVGGWIGRTQAAEPLRPGTVYAPAYVAREDVAAAQGGADVRVFVVIRDLRDTLVSLYFSILASHYPDPAHVVRRRQLAELSPEDGLVLLLHSGELADCARIQRSWIGAGVPHFRLEELAVRDTELLLPLLREYCGFDLPRTDLERVIKDHRFERLSGGRARGEADGAAHYRKGVPGDWQHYFSPRVTAAFKERYGPLLIDTGYERDMDWEPDPAFAPPDFGVDIAYDLQRVTAERHDILRGLATLTGLVVTRDEQLAHLRGLVDRSAAALEQLERAAGRRPVGRALRAEVDALIRQARDINR